MRQSKAEVYLHVVWTTLRREPFVTSDRERAIYRCIESEARRLGCEVLGIGGTADHVHLCLKLPTRHAISQVMNQVKGVSSHFAHDQLPGENPFQWQEGYGVFSIGANQVKPVLAYIANQKQHHTEGSLHPRWEESDEEYQPKNVA